MINITFFKFNNVIDYLFTNDFNNYINVFTNRYSIICQKDFEYESNYVGLIKLEKILNIELNKLKIEDDFKNNKL